ncbi:MAG TPA: hypothetical protein VMT16_12825, partial [Thermoanaerobaculia bacterium]|nr:hypothetical protein [Thermoanaerobaculia bacterium]
MRPILAKLMLVSLLTAGLAGAEEAGKPPEEAPQPRSSTTRHEVRIDGQTIPYRATAGWLILKDEE